MTTTVNKSSSESRQDFRPIVRQTAPPKLLASFATSRDPSRSGSGERISGRNLREDFVDWVTVVDFQPLAAGNREAARVEAKLLHDRGVNVSDVVPILDGV